jgi:membrane-associated protease RseP (regulator of RpoE activity)
MEESKTRKTRVIQPILFIVTIITTTLAGAEWMFGKFLFLGDDVLTFSEVLSGLYFSIPLLGILTVHEFGHFFTARYYKIKVTLPFYIPLWLGFIYIPYIGPLLSFGTAGAFIRIKQLIQSRKEYFDVGIAGPLAGFVVALMVLTYGFTHLPEPEYIFEIHPEYEEYGMNYDEYYEQLPMNLAVGDNLLFMFFENYVADPEKVPNKYELYHYPWLFAGFLALFFTALNLIPIGQLDGGHVIYGLFGYKQSRTISRILFLIMITFSGIGWVPEGPLGVDFFIGLVFYLLFLFLAFYNFEKDIKKRLLLVIWVMIIQIFSVKYYPEARDYGLYMVFAFILGRFLGIDHPKALIDKPLDLKRKIIGWIALGVFVVSFTPKPLYFEFNEKARIERPGPEKEDRDPSKVITWRMIEIF